MKTTRRDSALGRPLRRTGGPPRIPAIVEEYWFPARRPRRRVFWSALPTRGTPSQPSVTSR